MTPASPLPEGRADGWAEYERLRVGVENLANDDVLCGPWCNDRRSLCQTLQARINDWLSGEYPAAPVVAVERADGRGEAR